MQLTIANFALLGYLENEFSAGISVIMADPIVYQKAPIVQKVEPGTHLWCSCGRSASQPFCDGSHRGTGFTPKTVEIKVARTVAWCACKHSKLMPFCDGTHATL